MKKAAPIGAAFLPNAGKFEKIQRNTCGKRKKLFIFAASIAKLAIRVSFPRGVSLHRHCPMN
jgi:hypothetical protein